MIALIQLSPILLVISLIMGLKRPPIQAALMGSLLALTLWGSGLADPFVSTTLVKVMQDSGVLFLSTASVIAPGLLFVIYLERIKANQALEGWVSGLGWRGAALGVFVVLGLAPLLESMTGFGVSLIATVPLLLALLDRHVALRIALTGMCIMPWGTLGLATVIGAALAGLPAETLGAWSAWTSAPVFVLAINVALWLMGQRQPLVYLAASATAGMFVLLLHFISRTVGPEIAGVCAGGSVLLVGLLWARVKQRARLQFPYQAWPYLALLAAILLLKGLNSLFGIADLLVIQGSQVSWKPLASPGIALLGVLLLLVAREGGQQLGNAWWLRAKRPLLTILFFLFMSQVLVKAGFLTRITLGLSELDLSVLSPLIALFGGLSGFITGSNVGGNAIVMPSVAHLPLSEPLLPIMAAIQNSAAGHAALGSLPMIALLISLAKGTPEEEQRLVRFGFGLVIANTLLVATIGTLLATVITVGG
ncbi:transporter [Aeromonas cavernicola]|uniref:Transporter n=1 Tax=Aeromonas cavernicola TaxID=1006623 RepID=A0A2H9U6E3_9GAMM|nr:transporter [Aeromonas cavernicola]PJG59581.1 transporter [Aeromonas cavernicola]